MYNNLKRDKYPTLRSTLYMFYPSHNYHTINNNDMLLPDPRVEAIQISFRYKFVKVCLEITECISNVNELVQVLRMP